MKKLLPLSIILFLLWNISSLKAQCYGYVKFDNSVNGNGTSTFNITTAHANELILIAYDGWPAPGAGPITVDNNNATSLTTSYIGNSGVAEVYYYSAALAGTHTIVCTEPSYSSPYYLNFAAAFYDSATCTPLSGSNVTIAQNAFGGIGSNTVTVTTTTPNELIFNTTEFNTGNILYGIGAATGAKDLDSIHEGTGLDAEIGYTKAPTTGPYTVTIPDIFAVAGSAEILVALIPGTCSSAFTVSSSITQPSCKNNDGQIQLTVNGGTPPFTYKWSPNVSTTTSATGLSAGTYIATVTGNNGICSTVVDTFKLVGATVAISSTKAKCSPPNTGTSTVTITNGKTPYTYAWSNTETNQTATGLTAGKYIVTITDGVGCKVKDSINVSNYPAPVITASPIIDSVCYSGGTVITGIGGSSYTWLPAKGLSCTNCPSPTASPSVTTVYTVTGTDSNGCTNTATVTVKVLPIPRPIITGRDTICIGNGTTLNVSGADTYVWNPGNAAGTTYTVNPPVTETYTVKATLDGCSHDTMVTIKVVPVPSPNIAASKDSVCLGDSLTLEASGATSYRWSPGNSTNIKIHVTLDSATAYTLYGYGGTCEDSVSIRVGVIQPISATLSASADSVCPGTKVVLTADGTGGSISYLWSNGATSSSIPVYDSVTTTHTVVVTGSCGILTLIKKIIVVPLPNPIINGDHFECAGGMDTLTVSSSTNPTTYIWSNGQTGTSIIADITRDTVIAVKAYNSLGCEYTDTFHINSMAYPGATLQYNTACGDGWLTITATPSGPAPYNYHWSVGHSTYDTVNVYISKDTTLVTLTLSNGCSITRTATVLQDNPQMYACCDTTITMGGNTEIEAKGIGSTDIIKYVWAPSNSLNCSTCPDVIASPSVTTTYTVTGTDTVGCPIDRSVTVIVETPCYNFTVPNVFTPTYGGSLGVDNELYIPVQGFTSWSLLIFDRWGHEVYKSTDMNKYWDGNTESGAKAPEGVYYYVIDASCVASSFEKNGFIQLIR